MDRLVEIGAGAMGDVYKFRFLFNLTYLPTTYLLLSWPRTAGRFSQGVPRVLAQCIVHLDRAHIYAVRRTYTYYAYNEYNTKPSAIHENWEQEKRLYIFNGMFFLLHHGPTVLALKPICLDFIKPTQVVAHDIKNKTSTRNKNAGSTYGGVYDNNKNNNNSYNSNNNNIYIKAWNHVYIRPQRIIIYYTRLWSIAYIHSVERVKTNRKKCPTIG